MNTFILALIKDIVIPELTSFMHDKFNKTGELPTQAELQKFIEDRASALVMKSEAFIQQLQAEPK